MSEYQNESQRDFVSQHGVARNELPWETANTGTLHPLQPQGGCVPVSGRTDTTPFGLRSAVESQPRVGRRSSGQPSASGQNPVGIKCRVPPSSLRPDPSWREKSFFPAYTFLPIFLPPPFFCRIARATRIGLNSRAARPRRLTIVAGRINLVLAVVACQLPEGEARFGIVLPVRKRRRPWIVVQWADFPALRSPCPLEQRCATPMNTGLLNSAYCLQRDAYFRWWQGVSPDGDVPEYDEADAELIQQLAVRYPVASDNDIRVALARAMRLIDSAETIQSERDLDEQYDETPAVILQREHPGFSDTVYTNAENFGYYITR